MSMTKRKINELMAVLLAGSLVFSLILCFHVVADDTVVVSYELNGGSAPSTFSTDQICKIGKEINLPTEEDGIYTNDMDKPYFDGWYYDKGLQQPVGKTLIPTGNITLYAKWRDYLIITLDANGGYFEDGSTVTETHLKYNQSDYYSAPIVKNDDSNKILIGWTTDNKGENPLIYPDGIGNTGYPGDTVLYAKWVDSVSVVFDYNGGTSSNGDAFETEVIEKGTSIALPTSYKNAPESSLTLEGWYTDKSFANTSRVDDETIFNEDVTLYAKWSKYSVITLTNAIFQGSDSQLFRVISGKSSNINGSINIDTQNEKVKDKIFAGIYTEPDGKGRLVCDNVTRVGDYYYFSFDYQTNSDVTLYVFWDTPLEMIIDYNNGSDNKIKQLRPKGIKYKDEITDVPGGRNDYSFVGWSNNKDDTEGIPLADYIALKEETLYAIWQHTNHTFRTVKGRAATCTEDGLTDGTQCYICGEVQKKQEVIKAIGHKEIIIKGKIATCTEDGLTDGVQCSVCGEWITRQNVIPSLGHDFKNGKCTRCETEDPDYKPDEPTPTPTPVVKQNGLADSADSNGDWWFYKDGKIDSTHNGVDQNKYGWWRVENGKVNFNAQGIYQNGFGWWKTTNGKVTFKEEGVFQNNFGWWRVKDSKVDFNAQSIYQNKFGWWKTTNGKVTFKENGLFSNQYGTWKVENSKVNFNFNGSYQGKTIKNGKVV